MPGPFYAEGSATSREAGSKLETRMEHAFSILKLAETRGTAGLTSDEAELALGLPHQSCSARIHELGEQCGALKRSGEKRKTRSKRFAEVYVLPRGRTAQEAMAAYSAWCVGAKLARRGIKKWERALKQAAIAFHASGGAVQREELENAAWRYADCLARKT